MKFWMYLFLNSLSPIFKGSGTVNLESNCISIHMKANWMCYVVTGQWHWCRYVYSCSDMRAVTSHKSRTADHFVYFEHAEQTSKVLAHPDSILIEIPMECQIIIPMWRGGDDHGWNHVSDIFSLLTIVIIFSLNRLLPVVYIFWLAGN